MATPDHPNETNAAGNDAPAETVPTGKDTIVETPERDGTAEPFPFQDLKGQNGEHQPANLDFILDIPLEISVELGRTKMMINDLLKLGQGSVIELGKPAGDTLEILANDRLIAKGDVVVMNDKYGIRLTEVISTVERLEKLK